MAVKKRKYQTQNNKIWTLNFSSLRFVKKAQILVPALMKKVDLRSRGLTMLVAVEFCLQERIIQDFMAFVNTKRRGLL